jgi:DNA-binding NtrC family response regulator
MIALEIADTLREAGAWVVVAHRTRDAFEAITRMKISSAVIDIRLADGDCAPICQELTKRNIPFVFHTGYDTPAMSNDWPAAGVLRKPLKADDLISTLSTLS